MSTSGNATAALDAEVLEELRDPQSEEQLVRLIHPHLLKESHRTKLAALDLSVEDVLNGRFPCDKLSEMQAILVDWNARCGEDLFKF